MNELRKSIYRIENSDTIIPPVEYHPVTMSASSDDLTAPDACVNQSGLEITRYHSGELVDPIVGNIIYVDILGTIPFNGNALFWKFDSDGIGFSSMKISTIGVVMEITACA